MKKIIYLFATILVFTACQKKKDTSKASATVTEEKEVYAKSAGRLNSLTIVSENHLWEGAIGEQLRKYFAGNVMGLPQEEPLFDMKQMPAKAFSGFAKKARHFIIIEEGKQKGFFKYTNKYARPQLGFKLTGYTSEEIIAQIQQHQKEIIASLKAHEITYKQNSIKASLDIKGLKETMGFTLKVPHNYRIAKASKDFYWIRKNNPHGTTDLTFYTLPIDYFDDTKTNMTQNIIHMRDSIAGDHIVVDEGGRFITEEAYAPYLNQTKVAEFPAFETKGTWEVKNKYMAGPFVNYVIKNEEKQKYFVLEGFVFAPTVKKRNYMFELEAIIKTIKFQ